jgi:hypothetical protein
MAQVEERKIKFIVLDTFQKFFKIQNINDYSEVVNKSAPMLDAAAAKDVHLLFLHHAGKGDRGDLDSAIGSTAIRGQAQSYLHLKLLPESKRRIFRTDQRHGQGNFSEVAIGFDRLGWLEIKGSREDAEIQDAKPKVREVLEAEDGQLTEKDIRAAIPLKAIVVSKALREMFRAGEVERNGEGKKNKPFRYSMATTLLMANSVENGSPANPQDSLFKGGSRGENNSCLNSDYMENSISGHESKKETQATEKANEMLVPPVRDTNGTRMDTNQKTETSGHELKRPWEQVPR